MRGGHSIPSLHRHSSKYSHSPSMMPGMTPNSSRSTGNSNNTRSTEDTNPLLAQLQARNNMMNELLQHRLSGLTTGQPHNYPDLATMYRNSLSQEASAAAISSVASAAVNPAVAAAAAAASGGSSIIHGQGMNNLLGANNPSASHHLPHNVRSESSRFLDTNPRARRNSSLGFSGLLSSLNDDTLGLGNPNPGLPMLHGTNFNSLPTPAGGNTTAERRASLDLLSDAAVSADLRERIGNKRRSSLDTGTNSLDQSQHNLLNTLNNVESRIMSAELELMRRRNLQQALQGNTELTNNIDLEMAYQRQLENELMIRRRNSLDLAQRRNSLELAQRRNSLELAQRRNSLEHAQRRNSLDLIQRRNSADLVNNRQNAIGSSLSHSLALQEAQRRNSLELAQRRNSLEQAQRRNSTDLLNNRPDALRSNISHMLAEQFLNSDRRHTLSMGRKSSLQVGSNPIDPRHMESLFDDGSSLNMAASGLNQGDIGLLRRQSIMQSLGAAQNPLPRSRVTNQDQANNSQSISSNDNIDPEILKQQVSPFLNVVDSLQQKMQKSQESQKNIQTWDKKMGLKRSHSSTMTKTHRSRRQLRELMEAQKNFLEQKMGQTDNARKIQKKKEGNDVCRI